MSIKLSTPSNDSIATFTKRPGASDTFSLAASMSRGVCRSFDPTRRARSGKSAYSNNTCVARLFARTSAYTRGFRSQSRTSSNAYRRLRMQSPSIRRSSRSSGFKPLAAMPSSRRRHPPNSLIRLSIALRLRSSSKSSCRCTPSAAASVGCVSYRKSKYWSTKCESGSDTSISSSGY